MDLSSRRKAGAKGIVVAGSVWESRMKNDEVKGGFKVFKGEENSINTEENGDKKLSLKKTQPTVGGMAVSGKRKTWKSESFDGLEKNLLQISKGKTDEQCKELSVSMDGIKKNPMRVTKGDHCKDLSLSVDGIKKTPVRKGRYEGIRELSKSVDGIERSPIHMKKPRSEVAKSKEIVESGEKVEGNSVKLRKSKSDSVKVSEQSGNGNGNGNEGNSLPLRNSKSEDNKLLVLEDQKRENDVSIEGNEKNPVETEKSESEENCKEFGVCPEKIISSSSSNGNTVKSSPEPLVVDDDDDDDDDADDDAEGVEDEEEEEIEVENKSFDIKEMNVPEEKSTQSVNEEKKLQEDKPRRVVHEVKKLQEDNPSRVVNEVKKVQGDKPCRVVNEVKKLQEDKPSRVVNEVKRISQNKNAPFSSTVNKQPPPVVKRATSVYTAPPKPTKFTISSDDYHYHSFPQTQNKLQNLVDLVMWRDVSRSALVFGMGTFIIISSSYTQDLNISCISVISYLGLAYLAAIFLYRSIICRGFMDTDESRCVLGEEEAVWLLKLILPYLNEFLLKLRALFSGDPATTMKLAVLLFVLARCGSSITIWKMAKLGFFGVFTVPKVCSSYSHQLTAYGKFWIRRFRDAWDSCTHKKAVAVAVFTLVWNLSSIVARIWAAFMLFVALRYYQQKMVTDDWVEEEDEPEPATGETWQGQGQTVRQKHGLGSSTLVANKVKKGL